MSVMYFACETLTFHRDRLIPNDIILKIQYPLHGPVLVPDWREFMPALVNVQNLFVSPFDNLRLLLITLIDHNVKNSQGFLRVVYLYLGGGLLLTEHKNDFSWVPSVSVEDFCLKLGECMNQATHIRENLLSHSHNHDFLTSEARVLGEKLAVLCLDHTQLHHRLCLEEGLGRLPLHVFKAETGVVAKDVSCEAPAIDRPVARGTRKSVERHGEPTEQPWERRVRQSRGAARGLAAEVVVRNEGPAGPPCPPQEGTDFGFLVSEVPELGFLAQPESDWDRDPCWSPPWSDLFPPVWASL